MAVEAGGVRDLGFLGWGRDYVAAEYIYRNWQRWQSRLWFRVVGAEASGNGAAGRVVRLRMAVKGIQSYFFLLGLIFLYHKVL